VADPSITATFHVALAELAAKLAVLPRARKHLDTARALLPIIQSHAVHDKINHGEVALAGEEGDFVEALRLAMRLANDVNANPRTVNFSILVAHLLIAQTRFEEAEKWLLKALDELQPSTSLAIALRDTLMLLRLCQGELEEASSLGESIQEFLHKTESSDSFFGLWSLITQIRLLYRGRRSAEGLVLASSAIARVKRMADRNLVDRMQLLSAEGLGMTGAPLSGARLLADVSKNSPDWPLEIAAEASRVMGRLVAPENEGAAMAHFKRAERTLRALGNLAAAIEVEKDAEETLSSLTRLAGTKQPINGLPVDTRPVAAQLSDRIAALIETGSYPPLLASETLELLAETDCVVVARVVETSADGRKETETYVSPDSPTATDGSDAVDIPLGSHGSRRYEITVVPRVSATARTTLLSIERLVRTALAHARARQSEREQATLWPERTPEQQLGLICSADRMLELVKTIRRVADSNVTVLLTGETGVGKELFARALHRASSRSEKTFLPFNCSTVPRDMFDSQLFGHRRGSFTGAHEDSAGVIRAAAGGTLFLDEIGEMSLDAQPKLLRFLESGEVQPLGEPKPKFVDVRVVAATNANLDQLVSQGRFREDLFYRLNVIRIPIPPLRERREEIPALVEHFLERFGRELQKPMLRIADETLEYLVLYRWPGNVRQLSNEIRRMVALAEPGSVLMPAHLSDEIASSRRTMPATAPQPRQGTEVVTRIDQPLSAAVEHIERAAIQRAITLAEGRLDEAAKMLGLSRKGLYLKRQRLNLE
jgi:DNA-binding NtrC family response regulator/tetratricopeptide (TPR) repeat protein